MAKDEPLEPASDDPDVMAFLDSKWRAAAAAAREAMESLRDVHPDLASHLPETGASFIAQALEQITSGYKTLHRAGPFVLGQHDYDQFLDAQTRRRVG